MIINLQNFYAWKKSDKERVMHSNSGNIKFTHDRDANDFIKKHFKSLRSR